MKAKKKFTLNKKVDSSMTASTEVKENRDTFNLISPQSSQCSLSLIKLKTNFKPLIDNNNNNSLVKCDSDTKLSTIINTKLEQDHSTKTKQHQMITKSDTMSAISSSIGVNYWHNFINSKNSQSSASNLSTSTSSPTSSSMIKSVSFFYYFFQVEFNVTLIIRF
jgi:hypothetical protein